MEAYSKNICAQRIDSATQTENDKRSSLVKHAQKTGKHGALKYYREENKHVLDKFYNFEVRGDKTFESTLARDFVFHRKPFDWYNSSRAIILKDQEEILDYDYSSALLAGNNTHENLQTNAIRKNPNSETYAPVRRNQLFNQERALVPTAPLQNYPNLSPATNFERLPPQNAHQLQPRNPGQFTRLSEANNFNYSPSRLRPLPNEQPFNLANEYTNNHQRFSNKELDNAFKSDFARPNVAKRVLSRLGWRNSEEKLSLFTLNKLGSNFGNFAY